MTDQTRPLSDSELPTFDRPVEIIENPYANANRSYTTQSHLFNEAIINKYNRSGPRYTSYPTALEFAPLVDGMEARVWQKKTHGCQCPCIFTSRFVATCAITAAAIKSSPRKTVIQATI